MKTIIDGWTIDHDNGVAEHGRHESLLYFDGIMVATHEIMDAYGCGCEEEIRVPMEVVAEFLRACGYVVVAPSLIEVPADANSVVERVR